MKYRLRTHSRAAKSPKFEVVRSRALCLYTKMGFQIPKVLENLGLGNRRMIPSCGSEFRDCGSNPNLVLARHFSASGTCRRIPTEDMMSISRSSSLVCKLDQAEPLELRSTLKGSSEVEGRLGCEAKPPSNEGWFPRTNESGLAVLFRNRLHSIKTDPRRLEIAEAERKARIEQLRRTFARTGDALLWSVLTFAFATIALMPALGWF